MPFNREQFEEAVPASKRLSPDIWPANRRSKSALGREQRVVTGCDFRRRRPAMPRTAEIGQARTNDPQAAFAAEEIVIERLLPALDE